MSVCDAPDIPVGPPAHAARQVVHLSTVHRAHDVRITIKEAATLALAGYRVTVIARAGDPVPGLPSGLDVEHLPASGSRAARLRGIRDAVRRALAHEPALVHLHDPELLVAVPALRRAGVRVIYDMHEDLARQIRSKPWIPRPLRAAAAGVVDRLEPWLVGRCDGLVVVDAGWLERHPGVPHALCRNLPLAREQAEGGDPAGPVHLRAPRLVYAGGVEEGRGAHLMAEAMHLLGPETDARLDVCGPLRPASLAARLDELDPQGRMVRHGWLDRPRLLALLDGARAGLLMLAPQPNYEHAFATKLFEYLRAGIPVIASDLPSHREIVERHECGLIVPWGDAAALAEAVRRVLTDDALVERLAAGARRAWHETDTFEDEFGNVVALYEKLGVGVSAE